MFKVSANRNVVSATWKTANVIPMYKKDDETNKYNYRPISLLSVPGKIMESTVSSFITSHIAIHNLSNPRQWVYKKGHSTGLLLVKMTEDWRKALDNNGTVGIVYDDFKKVFDSTSHSVATSKVTRLGNYRGHLVVGQGLKHPTT